MLAAGCWLLQSVCCNRAIWLAGWLTGWLAGWLAGWLLPPLPLADFDVVACYIHHCPSNSKMRPQTQCLRHERRTQTREVKRPWQAGKFQKMCIPRAS
jgi:hypothetical protein